MLAHVFAGQGRDGLTAKKYALSIPARIRLYIYVMVC